MFLICRRSGCAQTQQFGYTIIELMIAITISLIILASLVAIFANNSRTRAEIERANQQTENGRYALQLITDDLHTAGYFAEFNPAPLPTPGATTGGAKPDPCDTTVAGLNSNLPLAVQGYDNGLTPAPAAWTCGSSASIDLRPGTDILVVRHASTCALGSAGCDLTVANAAYFQTSGCNSPTELGSGNVATYYVLDTNAASFTLHQKDCLTLASQYQYRTNIYFVANNDNAGDGIPTLKRLELGLNGNSFSIVPLVEGIENLQIEYGLDTSVPTTGSPAVYNANPDTYSTPTYTACTALPTSCWRNVVAAKINILARNTSTTQGYVDTKTYTLGLNADGTANTVGPFNNAYKRHAYESVVVLNNPAGRNTP
jgi:type IV pilus assembly protein PilW